MKKKTLSIILISGLSYLCLQSNSAGVGTVNGVNATSSSAGCNCHSTSATTSITATLQLLNGASPVTTYTPGASYTIKLTGTNTTSGSLPRFGYQVTAVKAVGSGNAGTLVAPSGSHAQSLSGINIIEQSSPLSPASSTGGSGTTYVVSIPWTAPVAGTGSVSIKSVINAINNNSNADASDKWNSATLTITEAVSSTAAVAEVGSGKGISVYPNPAKNTFTVDLPALSGQAEVYITNSLGQLVRVYTAEQSPATFTPRLTAGVYNVSVHTAAANYTSRLVVE
jgi:hypothetical protein